MTIEQAKKILNTIYDIAVESSLTGALYDGAIFLNKSYNGVYRYAIEQQWIEDIGIVSELDPETVPPNVSWMDYVGCSALLLLRILEDIEPEANE